MGRKSLPRGDTARARVHYNEHRDDERAEVGYSLSLVKDTGRRGAAVN